MNKIIFLFIIVLSCKSPIKKDEIIINNDFKEVITNYIKSNPIQLLKIIDSEAKFDFPQPSYHIFFDKKYTDTIISIKLLPYYSEYNPINVENQGDSITIYSKIKPSGYFLFENEPIIIFDLDNYSKDIIKKDKLISHIPDSLKFDIGKINNHLKSDSDFYKVSKLKFEHINWDEISHDKKNPKESDKKPKDTYVANFVDSIKVAHSLTENPLITIDGVILKYQSMNEDWFIMNKEDISSLKYIKNGETNIFGSKDKFGVVSLTTRSYHLKKLKSSPLHPIKRIYVIDGEIVTKEFVERFDKSKIISVEEISDKKSIAEFTSEDYDQLVYITTKIPTE